MGTVQIAANDLLHEAGAFLTVTLNGFERTAKAAIAQKLAEGCILELRIRPGEMTDIAVVLLHPSGALVELGRNSNVPTRN